MSAANNVLYHNFNLRHSCYGVVSHIDKTEVHSRHSATQELARTLANRASDEFERLDTEPCGCYRPQPKRETEGVAGFASRRSNNDS